jgi:hypothetical protein
MIGKPEEKSLDGSLDSTDAIYITSITVL